MSVFNEVCPVCVWGEKGECKIHPVEEQEPEEVEGAGEMFPKSEVVEGGLRDKDIVREGVNNLEDEVGGSIEPEMDNAVDMDQLQGTHSIFNNDHEFNNAMLGNDSLYTTNYSPFMTPDNQLDRFDKAVLVQELVKGLFE